MSEKNFIDPNTLANANTATAAYEASPNVVSYQAPRNPHVPSQRVGEHNPNLASLPHQGDSRFPYGGINTGDNFDPLRSNQVFAPQSKPVVTESRIPQDTPNNFNAKPNGYGTIAPMNETVYRGSIGRVDGTFAMPRPVHQGDTRAQPSTLTTPSQMIPSGRWSVPNPLAAFEPDPADQRPIESGDQSQGHKVPSQLSLPKQFPSAASSSMPVVPQAPGVQHDRSQVVNHIAPFSVNPQPLDSKAVSNGNPAMMAAMSRPPQAPLPVSQQQFRSSNTAPQSKHVNEGMIPSADHSNRRMKDEDELSNSEDQASGEHDEDDDDDGKDGKKSRRELPAGAVATLKAWLLSPENFTHPYPTPQDQAMLAQKTGIDMKQVKYWFDNARRRIWKPMLKKQLEQGKIVQTAGGNVVLGGTSGLIASASTTNNLMSNGSGLPKGGTKVQSQNAAAAAAQSTLPVYSNQYNSFLSQPSHQKQRHSSQFIDIIAMSNDLIKCRYCGYSGSELMVLSCKCTYHTTCFAVSTVFIQRIGCRDEGITHRGFCDYCISEEDLGVYLIPIDIEGVIASSNVDEKEKKLSTVSDMTMDKEESILSEVASILSFSSTLDESNTVSEEVDLRNGRWTHEETQYVDELMKLFEVGSLPLPRGLTLNDFLRNILMCKSTRLRKKMKNANFCTRTYELNPSVLGTLSPLHYTKLCDDFLLSVDSEMERCMLRFAMRALWGSHFLDFCAQQGFTFLDANDWLASLEKIKKRCVASKQRCVASREILKQKQRRKRLSLVDGTNSDTTASSEGSSHADDITSSSCISIVRIDSKIQEQAASNVFHEEVVNANEIDYSDDEAEMVAQRSSSKGIYPSKVDSNNSTTESIPPSRKRKAARTHPFHGHSPLTTSSDEPIDPGSGHSQKWEEMFEALLQYKKEVTETETASMTEDEKNEWVWSGNVPTHYKTSSGKALGRWVNNQRQAKAKGMLKTERENRLVDSGLKWSAISTNGRYWNYIPMPPPPIPVQMQTQPNPNHPYPLAQPNFRPPPPLYGSYMHPPPSTMQPMPPTGMYPIYGSYMHPPPSTMQPMPPTGMYPMYPTNYPPTYPHPQHSYWPGGMPPIVPYPSTMNNPSYASHSPAPQPSSGFQLTNLQQYYATNTTAPSSFTSSTAPNVSQGKQSGDTVYYHY